MKKLLVLILIQLIGITSISTVTWQAANRGFWQDSALWVGGVVPDTTSSDTFVISHPIVIESDLILESGAHMLIDSTGGICGHQIATVSSTFKL